MSTPAPPVPIALTTDALNPQQIATIFQQLLIQIPGLVPVGAQTSATLSDSNVIVVASNTGIVVGQAVIGQGIPSNATVSGISGTSITLSAVTGTGMDVSVTFFAAGVNPYQMVRLGWQTQGEPGFEVTEDVVTILAKPANDEYSQSRDQWIDPNDTTSVSQKMAYTQVWDVHFSVYGSNGFLNAALILSQMALSWTHDTLAEQAIYLVTEYDRPLYNPELFQSQWWERYDLTLKFNQLVNESVAIASALSANVTIITDTGAEESFTISAD